MRVLPPEAWVLKELRRGAQRRTSVCQPHGQSHPQAATPAAIVSCRERSQRVCPPKTGIDRFDWPFAASAPPRTKNDPNDPNGSNDPNDLVLENREDVFSR